MDVGDLLVPGLLIGGGYLAYRWYTQSKATPTPAGATGNAAADMVSSAARVTNFASQVLTRRLFSMGAPPPLVPIVSPQAPPQLATAVARAQGAAAVAAAVAAANAPITTAPAPNVTRWVSVGLPALTPTRPSGEGPQPGDPNALLFTRGIGIA